MALTPNDILQKEFDNKFRGYDPDQVNDYLDVIVAEYEKLIGVNRNLKSELETAKAKNDYFAQLQEALNSSIVVAQEAADRLKQNARKEAELIIYEAEKEADARVKEANDFAQTIVTETEAIRRNSQNFRTQLEKMMRDQLELVTNSEYKRLLDNEITSQYPDYERVNVSEKTSRKVDALAEQDREAFDQANQLRNEYDQINQDTYESQAVDHADQTYFESDDLQKSGRPVENNDLELEMPKEQDQSDILREEQADNAQTVKNDAQSKESLLGQTIRIELPKD